MKYNPEICMELLKTKKEELKQAGENRYPQRNDFSDEEVAAIKSFFGPWPRALEAAGVKPPRSDDRATHNKEKRIRAKRRRTMAKKQKTEENQNEKTEK
ncbi:MAG: hypothetical protein E7487_09565 [Ruminococcaceae bacterium]|nr:hypothetical protein [Oscillospiraceae bacterium]